MCACVCVCMRVCVCVVSAVLEGGLPHTSVHWAALTWQAGDRICILSKVNDQWLFGQSGGNQGSFPASFVDAIPQDLPLYEPPTASQGPSAVAQSSQQGTTSDKDMHGKVCDPFPCGMIIIIMVQHHIIHCLEGKRGPSSIRRSLELFQRWHWGNFWEMGRSAYRLFEHIAYYHELNWTDWLIVIIMEISKSTSPAAQSAEQNMLHT